MKNKMPIVLKSAVVVLLLIVIVGCHSAPVLDPIDTAQSIPQGAQVMPQRWQLANGLTVLFLPDDELPVVSGSLLLRGGRLWESRNEIGASTLMGQLIRSGGAGKYTPQQIDQKLEELSASISSSFGIENGGVSFFALKQDAATVFDLFGQVVRQPRFDPERFELAKLGLIDSITKRSEEPDLVTHIVATQLIYPGLPYGQVMTSRGIANIDRAKILDVYSRFVQPRDAILYVSGDISRQELEALVQKTFGSWSPRAAPLAKLKSIDTKPRTQIAFVSLPITQANVQLVQLGVARHSPDAVAIDLTNHILSSGFGSRLVQKIRTELGFAYVVGGGIDSGPALGMTSISLQTKAESCGQAIAEVFKLLDQLRQNEPSHAEVQLNIDTVTASFIFLFESPGEIVARKASQEFYGYPDDYDITYLPKLRALKPQDVRQVAAEHLRNEDFLVIVAGDETAYASLQAALPDFPEAIRSKGIERLKFDEVILQ